jgi:uncharacterized protein YdaU (DUF1376 family)
MKRPWMPFYPADFQTSTLGLDADEIGIYMILLCLAWQSGDGTITSDMAELKKVLQRCCCNFHGLTFNRIVPKLLKRFFVEKEGRMVQERVENELRTAREISEKQSRNSRERWSGHNKVKDLPHATGSATIIPMHIPVQPQPQSQRKKEREDAPNGASKYAFEEGIVRLNQKDFDRWKATFTHIELAAELLSLSPWAQEQGKNWFHAVQGALAKRNRDVKAKKDHLASPSGPKWNGFVGVL